MKKFRLIREYPGSPKLKDNVILNENGFDGNMTTWCNPKDYPEFWELVVEKDYEILSYLYKPNGLIVPASNFAIQIVENEKSIYKINSVKRLSDGEF